MKRIVLLTCGVICLCSWLTPAHADDLLGDRRWSEESFGLSLLPPRDAKVIDRPGGDALVAFEMIDGTQLSLFIRQSQTELNIKALKDESVRQFTIPYPSWVPVDDPHPLQSVDDHPAGRLYLAIPDKKRGDWVMGHVFVLIDPYTFANLQMTTSAAGFQDAAKLFDAVTHSIQFMDPQQLDQLRTQQLQAGADWLKNINRQQLLTANPPLLWLRIQQDGKDIGYMRLQCATEQQLGLDGISVQMRSHIEAGGWSTEAFGDYFESQDQKEEVWTQGLTRKVASSDGQLPGAGNAKIEPGTLRETAVRSGGIIQLTLESPTERRTDQNARQWQMPDLAYLSQVNRMLMGPMLPKQASKLAFYCYNTEAQNITLYTVRTEPILQGPQRSGTRVTLRPSPTSPLQTLIYDAKGKLVQWTTAHGRVLTPSTPEELRKIWNIQ